MSNRRQFLVQAALASPLAAAALKLPANPNPAPRVDLLEDLSPVALEKLKALRAASDYVARLWAGSGPRERAVCMLAQAQIQDEAAKVIDQDRVQRAAR